jgi:hypothetical protein
MRFHEVLWDSMTFHDVPWNSMRFYDVSVNQSVPTEANRGLTSYISVQKILLEHKTQGLRQALTNEILCRKQGKALPLEQPEKDHGGAV